MSSRVAVFGPAYLDRVIEVDGPLGRAPGDPPLDQSVEGSLGFAGGDSLVLVDGAGDALEIVPPDGWPGPLGRIDVGMDRGFGGGEGALARLRGVAVRDTLGGMGAGFAAALRGRLVHALGAGDDPTSRAVQAMLAAEGIDGRPIRIAGRPADWTLLVSSGVHGDKLAIGFRGCHSALRASDLAEPLSEPCDLRVVAGLSNRLAAAALEAPGARLRLFAPGMRNMTDRSHPVATFARSVDVLCCNRGEWEALHDRDDVAWKVSILVVTDGPRGATARFTTPDGEPGRLTLPTLHRGRPPRDTNHAGEALGATVAATLLEAGWDARTGIVPRDLLRLAMLRGSAAAALVLDRADFGFPSGAEVGEAVRSSGLG
ncbi:pfkB family carbohydrate kinase [Aquisphaera giovannonii]|uniref:PfkB family carbohydrate kinase n=1 Tax=Aquisphaera giovannonii TaxID=406548 RepID=A0A5B9W915_9BACT|nr:carbohydrate kinase family protein [Aquisphaera giovannonii]QEH36784.1 pfkB family carbohydrate kinase [Aquisphaera giovannonii]